MVNAIGKLDSKHFKDIVQRLQTLKLLRRTRNSWGLASSTMIYAMGACGLILGLIGWSARPVRRLKTRRGSARCQSRQSTRALRGRCRCSTARMAVSTSGAAQGCLTPSHFVDRVPGKIGDV
jgi:hypothetical protein